MSKALAAEAVIPFIGVVASPDRWALLGVAFLRGEEDERGGSGDSLKAWPWPWFSLVPDFRNEPSAEDGASDDSGLPEETDSELASPVPEAPASAFPRSKLVAPSFASSSMLADPLKATSPGLERPASETVPSDSRRAESLSDVEASIRRASVSRSRCEPDMGSGRGLSVDVARFEI